MSTSADVFTHKRSHKEQVLCLAREMGLLRVRDLKKRGIHPENLRRLHQEGLLVKVGRGLYTLADADFHEHRSLVEACKYIPDGIICLLSALQFHKLTTQAPFEVWMAIDRKSRLPKTKEVSLRIVRFSGQALTAGIEEHRVNGARIRVYSIAKTIVDCFKYRNKIGLDVALEAFKEGWREKRFNMDDLSKYARICRVNRVMLPYLEGIVA